MDNQKRLWLTMSRTLRVLDRASGKWITANWPAGAAGPSGAIPIGDGSAMYLWSQAPSDWGGHPAGNLQVKGFLATVQNGEVELSPAPAPGDIQPFLDDQHALWLMGWQPGEAGSLSAWQKVHVVRLGIISAAATQPAHAGKIDEFIVDSPPVLLDTAGGIVWLAPVREQISLWQHGKIVGQVHVPGSDIAAKAFLEKPGSVWVWTAVGLYHFAANPARPGDYALIGTFVVQDGDATLFRTTAEGDSGVSSRGFFYTMTHNPSAAPDHGRRLIHVIQLPAS